MNHLLFAGKGSPPSGNTSSATDALFKSYKIGEAIGNGINKSMDTKQNEK